MPNFKIIVCVLFLATVTVVQTRTLNWNFTETNNVTINSANSTDNRWYNNATEIYPQWTQNTENEGNITSGPFWWNASSTEINSNTSKPWWWPRTSTARPNWNATTPWWWYRTTTNSSNWNSTTPWWWYRTTTNSSHWNSTNPWWLFTTSRPNWNATTSWWWYRTTTNRPNWNSTNSFNPSWWYASTTQRPWWWSTTQRPWWWSTTQRPWWWSTAQSHTSKRTTDWWIYTSTERYTPTTPKPNLSIEKPLIAIFIEKIINNGPIIIKREDN